MYLNPGFEGFKLYRKNKYFVDKSMLIALLNERVESDGRFLCISRPRRFGKT
ncbi:MAG: AAA family ATPase, partial [Candidatus Ornithospirochaeta sp.]